MSWGEGKAVREATRNQGELKNGYVGYFFVSNTEALFFDYCHAGTGGNMGILGKCSMSFGMLGDRTTAPGSTGPSGW